MGALGSLIAFAISCSGAPSGPSEAVGSTASALTGCGQVQVTGSLGSPGSVALSAGVILPGGIPITNSGGFYPNIQVTATLGVGTTTCTYATTFASGWGDAQFQSCADGSAPGDVRFGATATLSISTSPYYAGTSGTATLGYSPVDLNACSQDLCVNGAISHPAAPDGTSCDNNANVCDGTLTCVSGSCNGTAVPPPIDDSDRCTDDACTPSTGFTHTYNATTCPPPPNLPSSNPSDPTVPQDFKKKYDFIYTGSSPAQTGVSTGTINAAQAAVLRGTVITTPGNPLPAQLPVTVTVLNHPEYGTTQTRSDGRFEMVVNGGEALTVQYARTGYLTVQRRAETRWHDWTVLDDAVMTAEGSTASTTFVSGDSAWHTVTGPTISEGGGYLDRTPVLIVPGGTSVTGMSGQTLAFRFTEFTVGANGPAAMPGTLPPQSAYTYALELRIDNAPTPTTFSTPVSLYVDNFNGTPQGEDVPNGYYDRSTGTWKGEATGKVLTVKSVTSGAADLSLDGVNVLADGTYGITLQERQQLAGVTAYAPITGKKFWRVQLSHFTPVDLNWGAPPPNAEFPKAEPPMSKVPLDDPALKCGSIIECESGVLGESIPLTGVPFGLHYRSEGQAGFRSQIKIPYTGSSPPTNSLAWVGAEVDVTIQGKRYSFWRPAPFTPNAFVTVDWDRRDGDNLPVQGTALARVRVSWDYTAVNGRTPNFGAAPGQVISGDRAQRLIKMEKYYSIPVGAFDPQPAGLGGWTVGLQHVYDVEHGVVWRGDGTKLDLAKRAAMGWTEVPAQPAGLPMREVTVGADGRVFVWYRSTLYEATGGSLVAIGKPNPTLDSCGVSNNPAPLESQVTQNGVTSLSSFIFNTDPSNGIGERAGIVALPKDEFLIASQWRIWRVASAAAPVPRAVTLVGGVFGIGGYNGTITADGAPAVGAMLPRTMSSLALGPDQSIYYIEYMAGSLPNVASRVRRILPNGKLDTLVGTTGSGSADTTAKPALGCWEPTSSCTAQGQPMGGMSGAPLATDSAGNVYFASRAQLDAGHTGGIWRITPMGHLSLVAGLAGSIANPNDALFYREGVPATSVPLRAQNQSSAEVSGLAWWAGSLYYNEKVSGTIRRIDPDGRTWIVAGLGTSFTNGASIRLQNIHVAEGLAVGPDGTLHVSNLTLETSSNCRYTPSLVKILPSTTRQLANGDYLAPSEDGSEVYRFDVTGRHQETLTGLRGKSRWQFLYDSQGRLRTVTDALAATHRDTIISYNGSGYTITGPWGKVNTITLTGGYISAVTEPETSYTLSHSAAGLLLSWSQLGASQHTFSYDTTGRLLNDKNGLAASSGITLGRSEGLTASTSTVTTAEGRTTTHVLDQVANTNDVSTSGSARTELRTHTDPNNLVATDARYADGSRKVTYPDGTTVETQTIADPRYGSSAPLVGWTKLATGSNALTVTKEVDAVTSSPSDPRTLTSLTTTTKINGALPTTSVFSDTGSGSPTVTTTSPVGRVSKFVLDDQDRIVRIEPQGTLPGTAGPVTPFSINIAYDTDGRLATVTQDSRTTTYSYQALTGFLSNVVGPYGTTQYAYTRQDGLPSSTTLPGGRTLSTGWDSRGNLTGLSVPRDALTWNLHAFGVDTLDRVSSYQPPSAGFSPRDTLYTYDRESSLSGMTLPTDTVGIERDLGGRPTRVSFSDPTGLGGRTIETTYAGPKILSIVSKLNGFPDAWIYYGYDGSLVKTEESVGATVYHEYDTLMRPSKRTMAAPGLTNPTNQTSASYTYDNDGLLTNVSLNTINYVITRNTAGNAVLKSTTAGAVGDTYEYDAFGALVHYNVKLNGSTVYDLAYDRSAFPSQPNTGRVKSKTEIISGLYGGSDCKTDYTYDDKNFLAGSTRSSHCSGTAAYSYDLAGNRNPSGWSYDAQDRLTSDGGLTYKYDNNGALTAIASPSWYDLYTWWNDAFGQIRRVDYTNGPTFKYVYDGLGRRVAKLNGSNVVINRYYWSGSHLIGEADGYGTLVAHYTYATRPNVPDFMVRYDGTAWQTFRLISDQAGSPKLLIRLTGSSPGIVERYDWDDWGVATVTWPGAYHPFGFAGGIWDGDVGNYRFGARAYDAWKGRWWSKDPIGFGGGPDFYVYSGNDPVNVVDPTGLAPGDRFRTEVEAAMDAANFLYWPSVVYNREGATAILRLSDGTYSYRNWWFGDDHSSLAPEQMTVDVGEMVAHLHVHPKTRGFYEDDSWEGRLFGLRDGMDDGDRWNCGRFVNTMYIVGGYDKQVWRFRNVSSFEDVRAGRNVIVHDLAGGVTAPSPLLR